MKEIVYVLWYYLRVRYGLHFRNRADLERYQKKPVPSVPLPLSDLLLPLSPSGLLPS
jgi:hypothetical protein